MVTTNSKKFVVALDSHGKAIRLEPWQALIFSNQENAVTYTERKSQKNCSFIESDLHGLKRNADIFFNATSAILDHEGRAGCYQVISLR